jgi:hypothetical protein
VTVLCMAPFPYFLDLGNIASKDRGPHSLATGPS